ncbi:MAG: hypothetical protein ACOYK8_05385 [Alphaproteobacteria bacterium]
MNISPNISTANGVAALRSARASEQALAQVVTNAASNAQQIQESGTQDYQNSTKKTGKLLDIKV